MKVYICLAFIFLAVLSKPVEGDLKICFFNIQIFGQSKMEKETVRGLLVQILSRYDVIAIQEIRDSSGTAIVQLLDLLNIANPTQPFRMVISERLGRTSSKEQYAHFYRWKKIFITETFQDEDTLDLYEREPFSVKMISPYVDVDEFSMMVIHVAPLTAVAEINSLNASYIAAKAHLTTPNFLIGGDFNADCSYVKASDWPMIPLKSAAEYTWLIGDEVDTTVKSTDCAYDRILTVGSGMTDDVIVQNSAGRFNYATEYSLSEEDAAEVSDHYPVEVTLSGDNDENIEGTTSTITVTKSFHFETAISAENKENAREIYCQKDIVEAQGYTVVVYKVVNSIDHVVATRTGVTDLIATLRTFPDVKQIIPDGVRVRLLHLVGDYAAQLGTESFTFQVKCTFQLPYTCSFTISVIDQVL